MEKVTQQIYSIPIEAPSTQIHVFSLFNWKNYTDTSKRTIPQKLFKLCIWLFLIGFEGNLDKLHR